MADAAEVLMALYESLVRVAGREAPVNEVFSLNIVESVRCHACNKKTHMQEYYQVCPAGLSCMSPCCFHA